VTYFAVFRQRGTAWDRSRPMRQQDAWPEHAAFMDALAAESFIILGGPFADGERVLFVVDAESEAAIRARLAQDPWESMGLLTTAAIEPWQVLLRAPTRTSAGTAMELFDQRNGEHVRAELRLEETGDLVLEGFCAGPLAERIFGDSDWEYWVTVPAEQKDRLLLELLHEKYAGDTLAERHFRAWLAARGVPHRFESY
jgi:uncharacterized protein YciI